MVFCKLKEKRKHGVNNTIFQIANKAATAANNLQREEEANIYYYERRFRDRDRVVEDIRSRTIRLRLPPSDWEDILILCGGAESLGPLNKEVDGSIASPCGLQSPQGLLEQPLPTILHRASSLSGCLFTSLSWRGKHIVKVYITFAVGWFEFDLL